MRRRHKKRWYDIRNLRQRAWLAQKKRCYWCGTEMAEDEVTADHLHPLFLGGETHPGNIVAACKPCNNGRHSAETNRSKKGTPPITAGDATIFSPFAVLKDLIT